MGRVDEAGVRSPWFSSALYGAALARKNRGVPFSITLAPVRTGGFSTERPRQTTTRRLQGAFFWPRAEHSTASGRKPRPHYWSEEPCPLITYQAGGQIASCWSSREPIGIPAVGVTNRHHSLPYTFEYRSSPFPLPRCVESLYLFAIFNSITYETSPPLPGSR